MAKVSRIEATKVTGTWGVNPVEFHRARFVMSLDTTETDSAALHNLLLQVVSDPALNLGEQWAILEEEGKFPPRTGGWLPAHYTDIQGLAGCLIV